MLLMLLENSLWCLLLPVVLQEFMLHTTALLYVFSFPSQIPHNYVLKCIGLKVAQETI